MTFIILGRDGHDEQALPRRMAARNAHLKLGDEMKARGELLYAVAMLDENALRNSPRLGSDQAPPS